MSGPECVKIEKRLNRFLEGTLPPGEAEELRRHISACPFCREELLKRKRRRSGPASDSPVYPRGDWLDVLEKKLYRDGPWQQLLRPMFLPWEKKIPLLAAALVLILVVIFSLCQIRCDVKRQKETAPATPPVSFTPPAEQAQVQLRQSQMSSVLILEEPEEVKEGEAPPASRQERRNYPPFQDQHIRLYAENVPSTIEEALKFARSSGGQVIGYPIKGFENMGPHERTLVFPFSTYRSFLDLLQALGKVEYSPPIRSDYVTVRLTVLAPDKTGD